MPLWNLPLKPVTAVTAATWLAVRKSRVQDGVDSVLRCEAHSERELHSVTIIHRHGHRTPVIDFPGQPTPGTLEYDKLWGRCPAMPHMSKGKDFFLPLGGATLEACKPGSLTELGQLQLLRLGAYLRKRYGLADVLFQDAVSVRSTQSERAVLSAATLLQGLCPGLDRDEALALVKTPHLKSPLKETMWATQRPCQMVCPRLAELYKEAKNRAVASPFRSRAQAILDAVLRNEGLTLPESMLKDMPWAPHPPNLAAIGILGDVHSCLRAQGTTPLPGKLSQETLAELQDATYKEWLAGIEFHSTEGALLSGSRLVADVQNTMQKVIDAAGAAPPQRQLHVFSGHDVSIISFLSAIGKPPSYCPGFASSTMIELWRDSDGGWHIRVVYFPTAPLTEDARDEEAGAQVLLSTTFKEWSSSIAPVLDTASNFQERCRAQNHAG